MSLMISNTELLLVANLASGRETWARATPFSVLPCQQLQMEIYTPQIAQLLAQVTHTCVRTLAAAVTSSQGWGLDGA